MTLMSGSTRRLTTVLLLTCALFAAGPRREAAAQAKPEGEMRFAVYVSLVPAWFDPGEVAGVLTPFWVLYALHDALVKPMPGNHNAPSLAESWTVSPDQRMFEFKLREGVKFHNGDPFTAEDVKFSFARAKGKLLHEKVREVEVVSPRACASTCTSRGPTSWPSTAPSPRAPPGSSPRSTSSRSARTGS